jgi:Protein of unknown function (DUF4229)
MNPTIKYAFARLGLFIAVALPLVILVPQLNILVRLMIAVIVSALLAFVFLRGMRDEVAGQLLTNRERRLAEKEKLRAALAGEEPAGEEGAAAIGKDGAANT